MPFFGGLKFDASSIVLLSLVKEVVKMKVDNKSKGGDVLLNLLVAFGCCHDVVSFFRCSRAESGEIDVRM